ncbi:hypothetical protein [Pleionea sediminis]|uniref:hypothetical protein n=1 Tax=Pleionea sediminis TaxID=2569479 RepID=UPI0011858F87|nr:hypothetical protein [Pleionea sediminis]
MKENNQKELNIDDESSDYILPSIKLKNWHVPDTLFKNVNWGASERECPGQSENLFDSNQDISHVVTSQKSQPKPSSQSVYSKENIRNLKHCDEQKQTRTIQSDERKLSSYYKDTADQKVKKIVKQFIQVLRTNHELGWLTDLSYQPIRIRVVDTPSDSNELKVYLSAKTQSKPSFIEVGDLQRFDDLMKLLDSGWPKYLKIELCISQHTINREPVTEIVFQIAYLFGTYFAPYHALIESSLVRNRLSYKDKLMLLRQFYSKSKHQDDRKQLHFGKLRWIYSKKGKKQSQFENLVCGLIKSFYKGVDANYLWRRYCEEVSRIDSLSGEVITDQKKVGRQFEFYSGYIKHRYKEKNYPWFKKLLLHKKAFIVSKLVLSVVVLAFLNRNEWFSQIKAFIDNL